ncbi:MAG: mevalonate kinase [Bradymonadaceae bacterium]
MSDIAVEAPGKLYLFGEYGVLAGGWSVVAAVDRRVRASRTGDAGEYRVRGAEAGGAGLVEAVLKAVEAETGRQWRPGHFETDASALYDAGTKLGLGSSAASCVALTVAAMVEAPEALEDDETRDQIFEVAERAHRAFQGGRGSGGGVAASIFGGVSGFRRRRPTSMFAGQRIEAGDGAVPERRILEEFEIASLSLPAAIAVRPVWLGAKASTTSFLGTLKRQLQLKPGEVYQRLRQTAEVARDAIAACRDDDADAFLEAVRDGEEAMASLGRTLDVSILTERHARLHNAAEARDIAVKPSGAGGGDFSLAVGTEETDWQALEAALPAGLRMMEMGLGAEGVF